MHVLITGISGRIGANLAQSLLAEGHTVRGLVWSEDVRPEKLAGLDVELIEGSLVNADDVRTAVAGIDAICHLGAAFQGGGPFDNDDYFEINVRGTFNMLEAAREIADDLQHFFFASTDAIYHKYLPAGVAEPIQEDDFAIEPRGWYALSKQVGENLCRGYVRTYGLPVTIFRFALAMAGDEVLTYSQFYLRHWLAAYAKKEGAAARRVHSQLEEHIRRHGEDCLLLAWDATGRSWKKHIADVRDITDGFTAAMANRAVVGETFQLAAPGPFTWEQAVPYVAGKLDLPYVDIRLHDQTPTHYEFDMTKGRRIFGYRPQFDMFEMIDTALAFRRGEAGDTIPTYVRDTTSSGRFT